MVRPLEQGFEKVEEHNPALAMGSFGRGGETEEAVAAAICDTVDLFSTAVVAI
jgi:hypothetical protein